MDANLKTLFDRYEPALAREPFESTLLVSIERSARGRRLIRHALWASLSFCAMALALAATTPLNRLSLRLDAVLEQQSRALGTPLAQAVIYLMTLLPLLLFRKRIRAALCPR